MEKTSACMPESIPTCQGLWDIFPEGTEQEDSLVLVSSPRLNGTPGNMLEGGEPLAKGVEKVMQSECSCPSLIL